MDRLIEPTQGKDGREKPVRWFPADRRTNRAQGEAQSADESTQATEQEVLPLHTATYGRQDLALRAIGSAGCSHAQNRARGGSPDRRPQKLVRSLSVTLVV
jgi:hypothetical protein